MGMLKFICGITALMIVSADFILAFENILVINTTIFVYMNIYVLIVLSWMFAYWIVDQE